MRQYPARPWVGIGVVVHKGQDILLIKRSKAPNKGVWSLPGGAQDLGETIIEGAKREVLEETNIETCDHFLIDCLDSIHRDQQGKVEYHYTLIEISCLYQSGILRALDDATNAKWVPFDQIQGMNLPKNTQLIIEKSYLSRKASLTDE
ncbi:NUDIX hydrolase [Terasakiella pusilla]|uniref:NUDIX hydrolase n=1 Tax=Terasakiella pusilla TaxID=64973 RepID=UPI00056E2C7B|nr:NUDIX hydrolase [Terasakiella pusilla]